MGFSSEAHSAILVKKSQEFIDFAHNRSKHRVQIFEYLTSHRGLRCGIQKIASA